MMSQEEMTLYLQGGLRCRVIFCKVFEEWKRAKPWAQPSAVFGSAVYIE